MCVFGVFTAVFECDTGCRGSVKGSFIPFGRDVIVLPFDAHVPLAFFPLARVYTLSEVGFILFFSYSAVSPSLGPDKLCKAKLVQPESHYKEHHNWLRVSAQPR